MPSSSGTRSIRICGAAVGEQELEPLGRVARIERDVAAACLQHREHRDDQVDGSLHAERDQHFRSDATGDQLVCQTIGAPLQFGVGQRPVAVAHRDRLRCPIGLSLKEFMQARVRRGHRRVVDPLTLDLGYDRQRRNAPSGIADKALEDQLEVRRETADRLGVIDGSVVIDDQATEERRPPPTSAAGSSDPRLPRWRARPDPGNSRTRTGSRREASAP